MIDAKGEKECNATVGGNVSFETYHMLGCFWFLHQIRYFECGDRFDHFGQQQSITAVRRQVRDLLLRFGPLQVVVGPVGVDLERLMERNIVCYCNFIKLELGNI